MSINTKELIKKYFDLLVQEFIKDPAHKDITIDFKEYLGGSLHGDTLGNTSYKRTGGDEHYETLNGVEVPGSRYQDPFKWTYTISFLNHYEDEERWRGTVCHEFAHLYLFSKGEVDHDHDDIFYSKMDYFEDWLDRNQGLSPRKDKGGDWNQHVNYDKRKQRQEQYPSQPRNDNSSSRNDRYDWLEDSQESKDMKEFNRLVSLIWDSDNLTELEKNYQIVKNSPLYDSSKSAFGRRYENNKKRLNDFYNGRKRKMCVNCLNDVERHQPNCPNKCSKCNYSRLQNDSEKCHNINCENYVWDPKWDREREEGDKQREREKQQGNKNLPSSSEENEYNSLVKLMKNSQSLEELEQNYQTVKNSFIYNNKQAELEANYKKSRSDLQNRGQSNSEDTLPTSPNTSHYYIIWWAIVVAFILLLLTLIKKKGRKANLKK